MKMKKLLKIKGVMYSICATIVAKIATPLTTLAAISAVNPKNNVDVNTGMGKIIGFLLSVTTYVGVGVLIYGAYELAMSFTQDMPDKKTKGIAFCLGGLILVAIKAVLTGIGVI